MRSIVQIQSRNTSRTSYYNATKMAWGHLGTRPTTPLSANSIQTSQFTITFNAQELFGERLLTENLNKQIASQSRLKIETASKSQTLIEHKICWCQALRLLICPSPRHKFNSISNARRQYYRKYCSQLSERDCVWIVLW